ncbi:hypothetical protein LEP1GSC035_2191 [Leptospira noguchii str. 2007001578]|uniref:Uncharacterized protein n=1 Tax=Leptospira noguchii str. 2007001578 TaxID=1049974 RepID=A0ABN0J701_9LEPT|nr:hypothetical protein LEP1GSC035_2191 [Leptospira noguchii str. 2007001578]
MCQIRCNFRLNLKFYFLMKVNTIHQNKIYFPGYNNDKIEVLFSFLN